MAEAQAEQTQELEQPEPVEQTELEAAPFMAEPVEPVESVGLEAMDFLAEISAELPAGTTFEAVD